MIEFLVFLILITYLAYLAYRDAKWVKKEKEPPFTGTGYSKDDYVFIENFDKPKYFSEIFGDSGKRNNLVVHTDQRLGD